LNIRNAVGAIPAVVVAVVLEQAAAAMGLAVVIFSAIAVPKAQGQL
jgi:uncharacterized membrane protein YgaE (UPF0421/DUF939 family)